MMKLLDVVVTLQDFPDENVPKGRIGTVVEELDDDNVLVEFADMDGVAYAISPIPLRLLTLLEAVTAAAQMRDFMQASAPTIDVDIKKLINEGRK